MNEKQRGFGLVEAVLILAILGIIGFTGLRVYEANQEVSKIPVNNSSVAKVDYERVTINGYKLKYPANENNKQVIIEDTGNTYAPSIAYLPVRSYFKSNPQENCTNVTAGMPQVDKVDNLLGSIDPTDVPDHEANLAQMKELISFGKAVQLDEDIYMLTPRKQNEGCVTLYESDDPTLKQALAKSSEIEKKWLKSIKLDQ